MSNRDAPRLPKWPRTSRVYMLISMVVLVVLAGGVLYSNLRGHTRFVRESPKVNASSGALARQDTNDPYESIKKEALSYYRSEYKDNDPKLVAEVVSYGCHMEVDIIKDGNVIKSFAYFGQGQFYELGQ